MSQEPQGTFTFSREGYGKEQEQDREQKVRFYWKGSDGQTIRPTEVYSREELEAKIKQLESVALPVLPEYREALAQFPYHQH